MGAQNEPNEAKGSQKGAKGSQKEAQGTPKEPKNNQNVLTNRPLEKVMKK
jgi:hypothetical protein